MEIREFRASDGVALRYRIYPAQSGAPRGSVLFLHGIRSHSGWYTRSSKAIAEHGFAVSFLDRRGSGLNADRASPTPSYLRLIQDAAELLQTLPIMYPRVLIGISWGAKIAAALPYHFPNFVDGLALITPGFHPKVGFPLLSRLKILALALVGSSKLLPIPLNEPDLFTASVQGQEFIQNDPLSVTAVSPRFFVMSRLLDRHLRSALASLTMPVLLQLAEHDRIIDNALTLKTVNRFPTSKLTTCVYPNSHHTLEFEPADHPWITDLIDWLRALTGKVSLT